jgi:hypothetical protein
VALSKQTINKVRFGIFITFKIGDDTKLQRYQIVGVDEADIQRKNLIHFSTARILLDKKVGETSRIKIGKSKQGFEIMEITENCKICGLECIKYCEHLLECEPIIPKRAKPAGNNLCKSSRK